MNIGIDKISFFVPPRYVPLKDLAVARNVDPNKYLIGIGQEKMSVTSGNEDLITLAVNASQQLLTPEDKKDIALLLVGTESSLDESKAAATTLHRLLGLCPFVRSLELKEACYGATGGLLLAKDFVATHPDKKVLVVATDIARYGLNSGGEVTQGAGAVAILVSKDPKILVLEDKTVSYTQDVYDFYRPFGEIYPTVDGPLSNETYIESFGKVWEEYQRQTGKDFSDFSALTFHLPYTKMGKKALQSQINHLPEKEQQRLIAQYEISCQYSRQIGNIYTGSLYLGLISLLENGTLQAGERIGLFSYGSGCVAEFFSGRLVPDYSQYLATAYHQNLLAKRRELTVAEYEEIFSQVLPTEGKFATDYPYQIKETHHGISDYQEEF